MRIKLSDYIAQYLSDRGITDVFTITGGGAMHLNDSFGHHKKMKCYYNHHEQACAMAAEAYARINNIPAVVCVTTGPGGTNAITGVLGAWLDSIPMLVISGQVRYDTTARSTGLSLRAMGDQEFDIVKCVGTMTKYSEMLTDPLKIKYALKKAIYLATHGRPGPCWLDIPLDVQGSFIETDELAEYDESESRSSLPPCVDNKALDDIINRIKSAERPILYAGNGIRIAGAHIIFLSIVEKLNIPVVTTWNGIDEIHTEHSLYVGRGGIMGDRAGNFAVQNSDLVLSIGNRLSIRQVGYNHKSWAREAFVISVDIDSEELKKPLGHVDMPIHADAFDFLSKLNIQLGDNQLTGKAQWIEQCQKWKISYPVVSKKHWDDTNQANVYAFVDCLSRALPEDYITVVSNGSACVVGSHGYFINKGGRFIINSAVASMGYGLPAAVGACIANNHKELVCIEGDGSIQMNLQELQTIIHNKLPIKIFIINNGGYHSIRQTQNSFFGEPLVGIGNDSGDLSFPSVKKLAYAYDYPYFSCDSNAELKSVISTVLSTDGYSICEIFVSTEQIFEPKSATKKLADGSLVSAPLEDLAPFLSVDELKSNMFIDLLAER